VSSGGQFLVSLDTAFWWRCSGRWCCRERQPGLWPRAGSRCWVPNQKARRLRHRRAGGAGRPCRVPGAVDGTATRPGVRPGPISTGGVPAGGEPDTGDGGAVVSLRSRRRSDAALARLRTLRRARWRPRFWLPAFAARPAVPRAGEPVLAVQAVRGGALRAPPGWRSYIR